MAKNTSKTDAALTKRSEVTEHAYRKPSQARGIEKFQKILEAAHRLIEKQIEHNMGTGEISIYDVAKEAGVATGSVYHFFPSIEAVYVALVEYYNGKFAEIVRQPIKSETVSSWQDILTTHTENCRLFMNSHLPALWLIIGPGRTWQSRQVDTIGETRIAQAMTASYEEFFELPHAPRPDKVLHHAIRILESFWELSYQQDGYVTDQMSSETNWAMTAYLSLYWPLHMEMKKL